MQKMGGKPQMYSVKRFSKLNRSWFMELNCSWFGKWSLRCVQGQRLLWTFKEVCGICAGFWPEQKNRFKEFQQKSAKTVEWMGALPSAELFSTFLCSLKELHKKAGKYWGGGSQSGVRCWVNRGSPHPSFGDPGELGNSPASPITWGCSSTVPLGTLPGGWWWRRPEVEKGRPAEVAGRGNNCGELDNSSRTIATLFKGGPFKCGLLCAQPWTKLVCCGLLGPYFCRPCPSLITHA